MEKNPTQEAKPQDYHSTQASQSKKKIRLGKVKEQFTKLPEKKPHLDFIAALLTIPLLLLTLVLNINNLTGRNSAAKITPVPSAGPTIIYRNNPGQAVTPLIITTKPQALPTGSQDQCIKDIGPIEITSPQEGQIVSTNPVCVNITYNQGNYCSVVWAYSINNSPLSDYSNNSVCLYSLPNGNNTFQLQVKSLVSSNTQTLQRNFIYRSPNPTASPTVTTAPTATPSQ